MKRTVLILALVLAMVLVPVSRAQALEAGLEPVYGGILRCDETSDYAPLGYPAKFPSMTHSLIRLSAPCLETLLRFDESGLPKPFLAENFETDAEANTITIYLRDGVQFHDGTPLDAEAVKWNLDAHVTEGSAGALNYSEIEIVDEKTLVIHLNEWSSTATGNLCMSGGLMISPTACEANGVDWACDNPVGTGPFKFVSRERDSNIIYTKNENYWQEGKPYLDGITITFTPDQTSRTLSFRNGDIDALIRGSTANVLQLAADGFTYNYTTAGTVPVCLLTDSANPDSPFANEKVREALAHAVDADGILEAIYHGAQTRTNQYAYPGHWGYDDSIENPEYDPDLAKQLLAEAGYPKGFSTTLTHSVKADSADLACAAIQDMLSEVGIDVTINAIAATDVDVKLGGEGWEGIFFSWGAAQPDSAATFKTYYLASNKYVSLIKPEELMTAIQNALVAKTEEEKIEYIHQAQQIVAGQFISIPLFATRDATVTQTNVHGTGLSQVMPATLWTPADAWIGD